jgi:YD repeat-containing protein
VLTVTNAKNETTTHIYNTDGYLTTITGPVTGATTTCTYDDYSRVRTVTDSDNYTLTYDYDLAGGARASRIPTQRTKRPPTTASMRCNSAIGSDA